MIITEYKRVNAVGTARVKDYSWDDFCNKLKHPVVAVGTSWEVFKSLPKDFDRDKNGKIINREQECQARIKQLAGGAVFGEMIVPDGVAAGRKSEYFPNRSAIVFDYENCTPEIYGRIEKALGDFTYCYHSTCKHRAPNDVRLHIIIPFAEPIEWKLYSCIAVDLARKIGTDGLDISSLRRGQMELYCVLLRGNEYVFKVNNKKMIGSNYFDTKDYLELTEKLEIDWTEYGIKELAMLVRKHKQKEKIVHTKKANIPYRSDKAYDFRPTPPHRGDVKSCFNATFTVRDILDSLPQYYSACGDRYTYYRGSGFGGVWVSDDNTRAGSFHADSGDPLFGRCMTAFDIFLIYNTKAEDKYIDKLRKAHNFAKKSKYSEKYIKLFEEANIYEQISGIF